MEPEETFLNNTLPSSTTTEDVKHHHSDAHRKSNVQTVSEYAGTFSKNVRESCKKLSSWSFSIYSGGKSSHYLEAENKIEVDLSDIPKMSKIKASKNLSTVQRQVMNECCQEYKGLAQVSTRAFTSKCKRRAERNVK